MEQRRLLASVFAPAVFGTWPGHLWPGPRYRQEWCRWGGVGHQPRYSLLFVAPSWAEGQLCAATRKDPFVGSGWLHNCLQRANDMSLDLPLLLRYPPSYSCSRRAVAGEKRIPFSKPGLFYLLAQWHSVRPVRDNPSLQHVACASMLRNAGGGGKCSSTDNQLVQEARRDPVWLLACIAPLHACGL